MVAVAIRTMMWTKCDVLDKTDGRLFVPLSLLKRFNIRFQILLLEANQVLYGRGLAGHFGFNAAETTTAVAINVLHESWLLHELEPAADTFLKSVSELDKLKKAHSQRFVSVSKAAFQVDQTPCATNLQAALNHIPMSSSCQLLHRIWADLDPESGELNAARYPILAKDVDETRRSKLGAAIYAILEKLHEVSGFLCEHWESDKCCNGQCAWAKLKAAPSAQ